MFKLILFFSFFLTFQEAAENVTTTDNVTLTETTTTANSVNATSSSTKQSTAKVTTATKAVTETITTTTSLSQSKINLSTPVKNIFPCKGWCLKHFFLLKKTNPPLNISIDVNTTKEQTKLLEQKFLTIISIIRSHPYFLVRSGMSIFADKGEYTDNLIRSRKDQIRFNKDIIEVPSEMFFPYTRNGIRNIIARSGYYYVPYNRTTYQLPTLVKNKERLLKLFSTNATFTNSFFEVNPSLYLSSNRAKSRKSITVKKKKNILIKAKVNDESIELYENRKINGDKNDVLKIRSLKIDQFLGNNDKKRTQQSRSQVRSLLGMPKDVSLLEPPNYEVDNIIAGMRTRSKNPQIFIIGATGRAQEDINVWLRKPRTRIKKVDDKIQDSGYILEGSNRQQAMDLLLRSMVANYQYQNKRMMPKIME